MKRGGQEIYVGPLGRQSSQLIKYFEVGDSSIQHYLKKNDTLTTLFQYTILFFF